MSKHWDIDEDYVSDVTNSVTLFSRVQATDEEMALAAAAPELLEALQSLLATQILPDFHAEKFRRVIAKALGQ